MQLLGSAKKLPFPCPQGRPGGPGQRSCGPHGRAVHSGTGRLGCTRGLRGAVRLSGGHARVRSALASQRWQCLRPCPPPTPPPPFYPWPMQALVWRAGHGDVDGARRLPPRRQRMGLRERDPPTGGWHARGPRRGPGPGPGPRGARLRQGRDEQGRAGTGLATSLCKRESLLERRERRGPVFGGLVNGATVRYPSLARPLLLLPSP